MHTILFCHAVVFNGICFDGFLEKYSGTHEDDEKIAKIRDVTLNHRNNSQRIVATDFVFWPFLHREALPCLPN